MEEFGERANEGSLMMAERDEFEALIDAEHFIAILNLKASRGQNQSCA